VTGQKGGGRSVATNENYRSAALFQRALRLIPGGVNSPVRAFGSVGGTPRFIDRAEGPYLWDADGNRLIDVVGSWGPMILGHAHPEVLEAITRVLASGTSFGAPTELELELAERVLQYYPDCERVRFVNSGTEATMSALRLARGNTGRDLTIKFEGNYHGHADALLVAAGSGALTTGVPSSDGVPAAVAGTTLVATYNDLDSVRALFERWPDSIAAVIVEPVAGNMGVVPPAPGFLDGLRELTLAHGTLLVIDEVMTGFRIAPGGAIQHYGIDADLVCWGKILGGGLPVGAYGGSAKLMDKISPVGRVYQAGTLSGNPLAMAAGIATLDAVAALPELYETLEMRGAALEAGLREGAQSAGANITINRVGSMLTVFFTKEPVANMAGAQKGDQIIFGRWFHALLTLGVYWPPSPFEAAFLSYAHEDSDIEAIVGSAAIAFRQV
jgi:glutamate-1-semialdehyde 2,1-aminomutase